MTRDPAPLPRRSPRRPSRRHPHRPTRWLAVIVATTVSTVMLAAAAHADTGPETRPFEPAEEAVNDRLVPRSNSAARVPAAHVPRPAGSAAALDPATKRFEGLSLPDQRLANNGNSFSVEP